MSGWLEKKTMVAEAHSDPRELTQLLLEAYSSKTRGLFGTPYCSILDQLFE